MGENTYGIFRNMREGDWSKLCKIQQFLISFYKSDQKDPLVLMAKEIIDPIYKELDDLVGWPEATPEEVQRRSEKMRDWV